MNSTSPDCVMLPGLEEFTHILPTPKWRLVFKKDLIKRQDTTLRFAIEQFFPIALILCTVQHPNCDTSEVQPSCFVLIFWRYINSIKNLSIAAKSQVKPLFYDIDEWDMPVLVQWNSVITTTLVLFLKVSL